jgi:hypothetical protein
MAVILEFNYGKKLGLPQYSSHNFSVSLKSEVAQLDDIPREVERVYDILQKSVDQQIVHPGFVPGAEDTRVPNQVVVLPKPDAWNCSAKQKELILKLVDEQQLDRKKVEQRAVDRFGKGVTQLNKLEASGLIDELMGAAGQPKRGPHRRAA